MDKKDDDTAANDDVDTSGVVMRRPKNVFEPADKYSDNNPGTGACVDGGDEADGGGGKKKKKRVKWSESTELRERLKVYRRSQLDIPLDYQHLAIEEEREREGVKVWRNILIKKGDSLEVDDESLKKNITISLEGACSDDTTDDAENDADSDEAELCLDEDMERKIQIIKEHTTRYTLFPAYSSAVPVYEDWLSKPENTKALSRDQVTMMKSQLELYKRLVDIYKEWMDRAGEGVPEESRFGEITTVLQEVAELGQPPQCVSKIISEQLADEENVQKQVDVYNNLVQEMLSALDTSTEV